jgi:hypothetical protein
MAPKAEGETAVVPPAKEEKKSGAGSHFILLRRMNDLLIAVHKPSCS